MEVGPTCHYVMGGIEVDPRHRRTLTPACSFAAGECSGGMHGSNRLGGNSLSDLLVFGRRAGLGAADYVDALGDAAGETDAASDGRGRPRRWRRSTVEGGGEPVHPARRAAGVDERPRRHHPHQEIEEALDRSTTFSAARNVVVEGGRHLQPRLAPRHRHAQHAAGRECVAKAALPRTESRGGHTRDDYRT